VGGSTGGGGDVSSDEKWVVVNPPSASNHKSFVSTASSSDLNGGIDSSAASETKEPRVNRFGIIMREENAQTEEARRLSHLLQSRDQLREKMWLDMINNDWEGGFLVKRHDLVKRRIRKGIPDSFRGRIWPLLCGASDQMRRPENKNVFTELLRRPVDPDIEEQINKDKRRTMQEHVMFRSTEEEEAFCIGQNSLFNVLKAYALHNPRVGYCQGMSSSAAMFVNYLLEEEAFWVLLQVLENPKYGRFCGVFEPGFPLLFQFMFMHEHFCQKLCPKLMRHFSNLNIISTMYGTRWFTTVFSGFPPDLVLRVWDIFLHEGVKILFRMAIALLRHKEAQLLHMDFENAVMTLQNFYKEPWLANSDAVIASALAVPIRTRDLQQLEQEYLKKTHADRKAARH